MRMRPWFFSMIIPIIFGFTITGCKKDEIAIISTEPITEITSSSAISGGNITNEGTGTVTSRGVCWSTNISPTISDNKTQDGAGAGNFTSNITGLNGGATYYVRAYAINSAGTGYGMAMSFITLGQAPTAITQPATNVTTTSATLNGIVNANYLTTNVTFEYGISTSYGQTLSATQNPVTGNISTNIIANLSGLLPGTNYHYRIKTVNSLGTVFGNDMIYTTLGQAPTATTKAATNITTTSAILNGTVNSNYLTTIVTFEYGTSTEYGSSITAGQSPLNGNLNSDVTTEIISLTAGMTYHFRLKAVNSLGTTYGNDLTFKTLGQPPTAITKAVTALLMTSANLNGTINPNYLSTIITFEYGTTVSYGNSIIAIQSPLNGNITYDVNAEILNLTAGETYHYRVKAQNSLGIVYGDDMTFTTFLTLSTVTDIDGNIYQTINIGTQYWMAENLKSTHYTDGVSIANVTDNFTWSALTSSAYCWFNNDETTYKNIYGALYNWYTLIDTRKLCPSGWHTPTQTDWTNLISFLGGSTVAGGKMKETGTSHWLNPNTGANNSSGFTGLPAGHRISESFRFLGEYGMWWSSTVSGDHSAWYLYLQYGSASIFSGTDYKTNGFSVRCIKD